MTGKTKLCNQAVAQDPTWEKISADDIYINKTLELCETLFPEDYACIKETIARENIFHAVNRNQIIFKDTVTQEHRTRALAALYKIRTHLDSEDVANKARHRIWFDTIREEAKKLILEKARSGKNLLVDDWLLNGDMKREIQEKYETRELLLYCSFPVVVNRAIKQNMKAILSKNLLSLRLTWLRVDMFQDMFALKKERSDQTLGEISKSQAHSALDLIKLVLPARDDEISGYSHLFSRGEFAHSDVHQRIRGFLQKFEDEGIHYIEPRGTHDIIIDTTKLSARDVALKLFAQLSSRADTGGAASSSE